AFATILSGKLGGMPWEALAGTIGKFEGPVRKPIEINVAGEKSSVRIPGAVELQLTPFRDVVSGQEKEVHIVYPKGGFFWNDAKMHAAMEMADMRSWGTSDWLRLFVMWTVMMAAMMLPSAAPVILLVLGVYRRRDDPQARVAAMTFVAGYLLAWTTFSAAAAA